MPRFVITINGVPAGAVRASDSFAALDPLMHLALEGNRLSCRLDADWLAASTPQQRAQLAEAVERAARAREGAA